MPRAERRKRENTKLLITSAKKIPKIYSFFKSKCSVSAEAEDDSGVNVTTAQCICEPTSKTTASGTVTVSEWLFRGKHKFHGDCSMEMVSSFAFERQKMYTEFIALKLSMLV